MNNLIEFIEKENIGTYRENVSFKTLTTYRCGGNARIVVFPNSIDSVKKLVGYLKEKGISYKVFGNGSNILASDNDYDGVIIKLTDMKNIVVNDGIVEVEAGYSLMMLANSMCKEGYTGLEFACGIPATIGGAVYMNAGAYLKDIGSVLVSVVALDNDCNVVTLDPSCLDLSYRHSKFMENKYIILKVILKLEKGNKDEILALTSERMERRRSTQPLEYPSAGSVFRNPSDTYAGKLIEDCNLKGYCYGGAKISEKHANFIVNSNNATSFDIKFLMDKVKRDVKDKFNVELHEEQELFNWE